MLAGAALLALLSAAAPDPCRAARAPLPVAAVSGGDRGALEDYRAAWRRVCDPAAGSVDLGALLGDAEALVADVRTSRAVKAVARAHGAGLVTGWPLPAILAEADAPPRVDWSAFAAVAERGTAEDGAFWRAASRAAGRGGEPAWLGEAPPGSEAPCVRLGELRWQELADALDAMERGRAPAYVHHAGALRAALTETLEELARAPAACACLRGDAAAGLDALAASASSERLGTPARRALAKAAGEALDALRTGRVRVRFLREAPGAPPTGCEGPR